MWRQLNVLLVLSALAVAPPLTAQTRPAPFYSLPKEGTWVEYQWTASEGGKQLEGTLRLSVVGRKEVEGVPCWWVEAARETQEGNRTTILIRKLLISEKAFEKGGQAPDKYVLEGYQKEGSTGPVTRMPANRLQSFLSLGFENATAFKEVQDREKVESGLGDFMTRHVSAKGQAGGRALEYDAWLTKDVPFGWVRFEMREPSADGPGRVVFRATAARSGQDARSAVDESQAR